MTENCSTTPYGSILRASDDTYWYTCGSWRLRDVPWGVPCILGYIPEDSRFPRREGQKRLVVRDTTFLKVANQPLDVYQTVYLSAVSALISQKRFGRQVFLNQNYVQEVRDPRGHAARFLSSGAPHGFIVGDLCHNLGVAPEEIGIWGSTLMFDFPVARHEIDIVIYGRERSYHAFEILTNLATAIQDLEIDSELGLCVPFVFKGIFVDLFFDPGVEDHHFLSGVRIRRIRKLWNKILTIEDNTEALFYPAIYETSSHRLLSFRPAHARRFFKQGSHIRFESFSLVEVEWQSGKTELMFAVLDYERADLLN